MALPACDHEELIAWRRTTGTLWAYCPECHRLWRLIESAAAPARSAELVAGAMDANVEVR